MHSNSERGTGRTTRILERVPDGAIFLVHTRPMKDYATRLLVKAGRSENAVKVMIVDNCAPYIVATLRGLSAPVYADHALIERMKPELHHELKRLTNYQGMGGE